MNEEEMLLQKQILAQRMEYEILNTDYQAVKDTAQTYLA